MKLTTDQILAFKAKYETRFDNEVITEPGAFCGMAVKAVQQVMVNLGQKRYVDWLLDEIEHFSKDETLIDQVYDEYYNDQTYAWYAVAHYISKVGASLKERFVMQEQPPVNTLATLYDYRARYNYHY